jgi:hypothetical protein
LVEGSISKFNNKTQIQMNINTLGDCSNHLEAIKAKLNELVIKDFNFKVAMSSNKFESQLSI